ncbi:helix-turn-helix domain-containing protein [Mammaliicoccus fleurettii]|uniref:helix-turn-helix domain-containing protein n=1 Tax=Mammaliicoccus fleurettii TaxID=150056 RepID=UPI002DB7F206|nr:helix-turn-helix transcriptional regulator [Mammaliicoccus fleurettii]MEB8067687.1 helix-turn-helix domain-containing protein [Mammaliicoccus fleurettii]
MELKDILREERKKKGFSLRGLAKSSSMSQAYLSQLENGSSTRPTKEKLLSISYALDPTGHDKVFSKLANTTDLNLINPEKTFNEFVNSKTFNFDLTKITNKLRINKEDKTVIELDVPSFDIDWLLQQDKFEVYLGATGDYVTNLEGDFKEEVLILKDDEKEMLREKINEVKEHIINERNRPIEESDKKETEQNANKYMLIKDLLNNEIEDNKSLIERIYKIKENKNLLEDAYLNELFNAAKNNDAIKLQKLIDIDTINEFNSMR